MRRLMKRLLFIPVLVVHAVGFIIPTRQCAQGGVTVPSPGNGEPGGEFCPSPRGCAVAPPMDCIVFPMDEVTGEPGATLCSTAYLR